MDRSSVVNVTVVQLWRRSRPGGRYELRQRCAIREEPENSLRCLISQGFVNETIVRALV